MSSDAVAISTRGLTRRFGAVAAVDDLDLDVAAGQIFGFLGPNAAGKTTTIRMLTGILRPSAGQGTVLGFDLNRQAESIKRRIGYVAQHFGLYDQLTASENLDFYARVYGGGAEGRPRRLDPALRLRRAPRRAGEEPLGRLPPTTRPHLRAHSRAQALVTSIVLSIGFFSFMGASLSNIADFGLLCGIGVILAFLADVVMLPALVALAAPCGADCPAHGRRVTPA
jgi:hypothetical protein